MHSKTVRGWLTWPSVKARWTALDEQEVREATRAMIHAMVRRVDTSLD